MLDKDVGGQSECEGIGGVGNDGRRRGQSAEPIPRVDGKTRRSDSPMEDVIRRCDLDSSNIPRQKIQPWRGRGLGAVVRPCGLALPRAISKLAAAQSPIGQGRIVRHTAPRLD